jgi:hypothetical protein
MPMDMEDKVMALSVRSSDFIAALDQEPLKVTGLSAARYTLTIDGEKVGSFTKEQLEEGINLATLPTPMAKQAAKVHDLTLKHNDIHFARWRDVEISLKAYKLAGESAVVAALDELEKQIVELQRAAAKPQQQRFELTPE